MRSVPPDTHPEWWATHVALDDVDPTTVGGRGLIVDVDRLDAGSVARLVTALDIPTVDAVHLAPAITLANLVHAIVVLRECQSRDIDVDYAADAEVEPTVEAWMHLLPRDRAEPLRYTVYRRHGPGFVLVVDDRPDRNVRITFDDEGHCAFLVGLDTPAEVASLDAETLDMFVRFGLVAVVGGWAVGVVPRIRRWPVPLDDLFAPPTA